MTKVVRLPFVHRSIRLLYLAALMAIITLSVGTYAASVTIQNSNNAGYQGVYELDNGYYSASAAVYNVVNTAQVATTPPLAWASGGIGYVNALVAGDWEIAFTLQINAGGLTSHTYTITVSSTAVNGVASTLYTFQFTSPASITPLQTMTIIWDTGAVTWTAPAALQITVA
ncbi:MAG: hypothetical protein ABSG45_01635 [Nitrososphaerales archaeon]|jgi:hypothetical protein